MWILAVGLLLLVISIAVSAYRHHFGIGQVKITFSNSDTGTTVRVGQGSSVGDAMADGFRKLYGDLSSSSRLDTVQARYNVMQKTLAENRDRMFQGDICACETFLRQTKDLLDRKQAEVDLREAERRKKEQAARDRRAEQIRRRQEREKERLERERKMPEHRRFVAEQRRLMTDSMRYDVLSRDGFRCQICGATADDGYKLHVDHILPVSKGGKTEMSNLRTLCERCNMGKSDKIETISMPAPRASVVESPLATALRILQEHNEEYVDKTSSGGALYFYSDSIAEELKGSGLAVSFAPNGTKGTGHRPAWFVK